MENGRVLIVDDDEAVRQATSMVLRTAGYDVEVYTSGDRFLSQADISAPACVLLDLNMPGMSGIEVLTELRRRGSPLAVVLLTGYGNVPTAVAAMQAGASDFIEKPYDPERLGEAVEKALRDVAPAPPSPASSEALERIKCLSPRQRQVLIGLVEGLPNKLIADKLGVSPRTIEMHRADMMDRLGVTNLSEALRLAYDAGLASDRRSTNAFLPGGRRTGDQHRH